MATVTSKLQVTIPKAVAERFDIRLGDEIDWVPAGDGIRVVPHGAAPAARAVQERLQIFDQATERQRECERQGPATPVGEARGWTRDQLYQRGGAG